MRMPGQMIGYMMTTFGRCMKLCVFYGAVALLSLQGVSGSDVPRVRLGDEVKDGRPSVRWRGFNLVNMLVMGEKDRNPSPFKEGDFRIIRDWGFNFVRIPMDYRFWIKGGNRSNWEKFNERHLGYVDRAVNLGRKYGLHVSLNMHRCPGYTVASPKEPTDLFSDPETLRVCCVHWAMFAKRYRGIPNASLSFNLFNEPPSRVSDEDYGRVVKALTAAIRAVDPDRFIIADGANGASSPAWSVAGLKGVGQSTRGYAPTRVTHYMAPWAGCPSAKPIWPMPQGCPSGILAGPNKKGMHGRFVLQDLPPCVLTVNFDKASDALLIRFAADGMRLKDIAISPQKDNPAWRNVKYMDVHKVWQGVYTGRETFRFEKPVKKFSMWVVKGDWIQISDVRLTSPDWKRHVDLPCETSWRAPRDFTQRFAGWDAGFVTTTPSGVPARYDDPGEEYIYRSRLKTWDPLIEKGVFCFAGEFGVWRMTPHDVTLRIMEDYLRLWKERNMGWALWNLRGGNGVLDSGRADVEYENFRGHKLDRKMLELLQRY